MGERWWRRPDAITHNCTRHKSATHPIWRCAFRSAPFLRYRTPNTKLPADHTVCVAYIKRSAGTELEYWQHVHDRLDRCAVRRPSIYLHFICSQSGCGPFGRVHSRDATKTCNTFARTARPSHTKTSPTDTWAGRPENPPSSHTAVSTAEAQISPHHAGASSLPLSDPTRMAYRLAETEISLRRSHAENITT